MSHDPREQPHLHLEDFNGGITLVPMSYLQVISTAKTMREAFVFVSTLRGVQFLLDPDTVARMYLVDAGASQVMREAREQSSKDAALAEMGITTDGDDSSPIFASRAPGLDW